MYPILRVAVIGGSGFVGSYVAEKLSEASFETTIATRNPEHTRREPLLVLPKVLLATADVHDDASLESLVGTHNAVISMAGILHGSRSAFETVHVRLVERIIAACKKTGVRRLVHISALGAAPDAPSDYQQTKGIAEQRIAESGLDWTILRPSVVFGAGDNFLNMFARLLKAAPFMPLAGADTRMQPVWANDVAQAVANVLPDPATFGMKLDLAGPRVYTLRELVEYVGRLTGHERSIIAVPPSVAMLLAWLMEVMPGPTLMSRDNVRSLSVDNVSEAPFPTEVLGFSPTPLEAVAPHYLADDEYNHRLNLYRSTVRR